MRILRVAILLFISIFILSACEQLIEAIDRFGPNSTPIVTEDDPSAISPIVDDSLATTTPNIQEDLLSLSLMIETRDLLRDGNLYIETEQFRTVFGNRLSKAGSTQGSGFVFYQEGTTYYVLTNYHILVSEGLTRSQVSQIETLSNQIFEATVVKYDASLDLAVLKFTTTEYTGHIFNLNDRKAMPLASHEFILAVGNPLNVKHMVTYGIYISMYQISSVDFEVLYHSAILHPGSSGGALTDINGFVVGVNTWSASGSDVDNFAIPLEVVIDFLEKNDLDY